jgi:hypothetical protein
MIRGVERGRPTVVPVRHVVDDAEDARRALARLERSAGCGLDRATIGEVVGRVEDAGRSLATLFRRLIIDLGVEDGSPETPHLRAAHEHAHQLADSLRHLAALLDGDRA